MRARTMAILAIGDRDRDDGTRTAHLKENAFLFKNIEGSQRERLYSITNNSAYTLFYFTQYIFDIEKSVRGIYLILYSGI